MTPGYLSATITEAFDEIAATYDSSFTNSLIGSVQRKAVWMEIDRAFAPGQHILEINCGTGVDALHLARRGVHVTACDSAPQMIDVARQRATLAEISATVDFRVLANERIGTMRSEGPFEGIFSNFSGLNCMPDLSFLAYDLAHLVKERSKMVLCLFGRLCIWETCWYLSRGNIRKAVRRFTQGKQTGRHSTHYEPKIWYHSLHQLKKTFSPYFRLTRWKGVGVTVPPSYLEFLTAEYPRLFRLASGIDPWLGGWPGFRALADHMLLTFERTER
jgi:SAM-dependent methyltransferase